MCADWEPGTLSSTFDFTLKSTTPPFLLSSAVASLHLMASSHCHCHCHCQQQQKYKHHQSQTSSCHCCHSTCCTPIPPPPHHHHHHHHHQCCSSFSLPHNNNTANTSIDYPILLQTLATYILQSQSHFPKPKSHYHKQQQPQEEEESPGALLTSRIDALESFQHHISTSPPPPTPTPKPVPRSHSPLTLRDLAARTIQTHFRAFLVRRSRNLRHLKHLAIIKSNFTLLKSSTHLTCQALSHKAMDLLLNLNSIPDSDPMIRDGKRSISRDLLGFLEFLDNGGVSSVTVKRQLQQHKLSSSYLKQPPPLEKKKKNVRFSESISESRVYSDPQEKEEDVIHNEEAEEDEQRVCSDHSHQQQQQQQLELVKNLRTRLEELEGCSRNSERNVMTVELPGNGGKNNVKNRVGNGGRNGNLIFSAPLPVQMEPSR